MRRIRYLRKRILIPYLFVLGLLVLIGCGPKRVDTGSDNENSILDLDQTTLSLDIESFYNLKEHIIQNDLKIEQTVGANGDFILNIDGGYDLNDNGKIDVIEVRLVGRQKSIIRINENEITIDCDHPFNFYLVDLVKDDQFIEIAIYDDGPSGDPKTTFYRYDGNRIYEIGTFDTDISAEDSMHSYYGNVMTDGKGNFIPPNNIAKFISPNIVNGYYSLEDNRFIYHSIDYSEDAAENYIFTTDIDAFFIERDMEDDFSDQYIELLWDDEKAIKFEKGEEIKILAMDEELSWYGVQLSDGTIGILYFWMGD